MASNIKDSLGIEDLGTLLEELHDVRSKWYFLGLQLKLPVSDLNRIKEAKKNEATDCLLESLSLWLERAGENATWSSLFKALKSKTMQAGSLAERIQGNYQLQQNIPESTTQGFEQSAAGSSTAAKGGRKRSLSISEPGTSDQMKTPSSKRIKFALPESFNQNDFVAKPPPDRLCIKCSRVPLNPQRSLCCNRLYCKPCADKTKNCSSKLHTGSISYESDKTLAIKVGKLRAKCINSVQGCEWKGELYKMRYHLPECNNTEGTRDTMDTEETGKTQTVKTNRSIPLVPSACIKTEGTRDAVGTEETRKTQTLKRNKNTVSETASFANEDFVKKQRDEYHCVSCNRVPYHPLRSHCCSRVYCEPCSKVEAWCPVHQETRTFTTDSYLKHRINKLIILCPHRCGWKAKMYQLKEHIFMSHTEFNSTEPMTDGNQPGTSTPPKSTSVETEMVQDHIVKIHSTNGTGDDSEQTVLHSPQPDIESLKAQVDTLTRSNNELKAELQQLRKEQDTRSLRTLPLTFHIPSLSSHQSPHPPWKSHSFYTHQLGYKVHLLVQVNGVGTVPVLAVGLVPEQGENDSCLQWPVSGRMDIQLLNQNADRDHSNITPKFVLQKVVGNEEEAQSIKLKGVRIPTVEGISYTTGDDLYFRLLDVKLEENAKPWLLSYY